MARGWSAVTRTTNTFFFANFQTNVRCCSISATGALCFRIESGLQVQEEHYSQSAGAGGGEFSFFPIRVDFRRFLPSRTCAFSATEEDSEKKTSCCVRKYMPRCTVTAASKYIKRHLSIPICLEISTPLGLNISAQMLLIFREAKDFQI